MNINNRRRRTQRSFTIWAENDFWTLLAKGLKTQRRLSKSQFIRDAIAYKMKTDFGINVSDELIVPLPPYTHSPKTKAKVQRSATDISLRYPEELSDTNLYVAEEKSLFGKATETKKSKSNK